MARVKSKTAIGKQLISILEVEGGPGDQSNSFLDNQGILHHNCNGPHVPLVVVDEVDTVSGEGLKAFRDVSGMLDSKGDKKALRVGISTRKSRYGLMNQAIENADKEGRTVRKWTVLEFSQRCPDSRSGTTPTIGYYLQDKMETISHKEWLMKDPVAQKDYVSYEFYGEKCLKCPLSSLCLSDSKKQTCKSPMLKPIDDAVKKAIESGPDWAIAQLFNLKPSVEGIIYKEFEEKTHVKTWNGMWAILTGSDFPGECTHDLFVKKCRQMKLPAYGMIDWGWSNPSTLVVFFVDNAENIYVVRADGRTYYNNVSWIQFIKSKYHHQYGIQLYFPDLANPGDGQLMRQEGLMCPNHIDKNISDGIQVVKKYLRSFGNPNPKLFVAKETCAPLIQEFLTYHYETDASGAITDRPADEFNHWCDALRYGIYTLFGKPSMITADSGMDYNPQTRDNQGNFTKVPTPEEIVSTFNLDVNTEPNTRKIGEIGTLSKLNGCDDDETISGGGGFLWHFN